MYACYSSMLDLVIYSFKYLIFFKDFVYMQNLIKDACYEFRARQFNQNPNQFSLEKKCTRPL